jgi:hypothetical protein
MPENSQRTYYINRDELFKKQGFYGINYTDFFTREPIDKKTLFLVKNCEMEDHRLQKLIAGKTQYTNENGIAHRCDISVNPNPTTGFATITIKGIDYVNSFFSVYDINGQLVIPDSPVQSFSFKFDISYLPTGIYTMRLKTNRSIYNTKIVKL